MTKAIELTRVFRSGSMNFPDPNPSMSPEKVKEMYALNHSHLATANIEPPIQEGSSQVYVFSPQVVKTKG